MYHYECVVCHRKGTSQMKTKKYCSRDCLKKYDKEKYGRKGLPLPTATVGAIAEFQVATDLMRKGFSVFRALSAACYCDLIAIKTKEKVKLEIEVRTGYFNRTGNLNFPMQLSKYDENNITVFAVVERNTGATYYFDTNRKSIEF